MGILAENENTNIAYLKWMKIFLEWHGPVKDRAEAFSQKTIETFIEHLKDKYSPSSVNQAAAAIKKWARGWGYKPDITNKPKIMEQLPGMLEEEAVTVLIDNISGVRDRTLVALIYDCALRVSEVVDLNLSDLDFENDCVLIKSRKEKGKTQNIPFSKKTKRYLEDYVRYLRVNEENGINDKPLFIGKENRISVSAVERIVKKYGEIILGKHLNPNTLRRQKATSLRKQGVPIDTIADFLGHLNINATLRYARLPPSALKKLPETY